MFKLIYIIALAAAAAAGAIYTFVTGKKGREADMYLPGRLAAMGVTLLVAGVGLPIVGATRAADKYTVLFYIGGAALVAFGVVALLCWKNQKVHVISDEEFTYTTFLGRTETYRFDEIVGIKRNSDSVTLLLKYGKVHMESMAVISDRFRELLIQSLQQDPQA